jgi:preprotein translocase subunit YajC
MLATLLLFADDAAQQPQGGPPPLMNMIPLFVIVGVFLILMMRGSRRQERERQTMISNLEKNDKVLTVAGIYGTVISISPNEDEIVVKVDDNTRLKMTKASIQRNISKEQAAAAAKADAGATSTAIATKPNS